MYIHKVFALQLILSNCLVYIYIYKIQHWAMNAFSAPCMHVFAPNNFSVSGFARGLVRKQMHWTVSGRTNWGGSLFSKWTPQSDAINCFSHEMKRQWGFVYCTRFFRVWCAPTWWFADSWVFLCLSVQR